MKWPELLLLINLTGCCVLAVVGFWIVVSILLGRYVYGDKTDTNH